MARLALAVLVGIALAGCSQNEEGRKAVEGRCIADGKSETVCKCLADESAKKLDKEMFDIVVLGARGDREESARQISELAKDKQVLFALTVQQVKTSCEAAATQAPAS